MTFGAGIAGLNGLDERDKTFGGVKVSFLVRQRFSIEKKGFVIQNSERTLPNPY